MINSKKMNRIIIFPKLGLKNEISLEIIYLISSHLPLYSKTL